MAALTLSNCSQNPIQTQQLSLPIARHPCFARCFTFVSSVYSSTLPPLRKNNTALLPPHLRKINRLSCSSSHSTISIGTNNYEFCDAFSEVELRLQLEESNIPSCKDVFVDTDQSSLTIRVKYSGSFITLVETEHLYDKIRPSETTWYLDDDQLVVNLKKQDTDLKWPDIVESWESLTEGAQQFLKGVSIYLVGKSTDVHDKVARELAVGLGYTPLSTKELLETFAKQSIDSWVTVEGSSSIADAESNVLETLSSHVRTVVATLGGPHGAAWRTDKWRHLYAGFTVWLSQDQDESSAEESCHSSPYSNADVVVQLGCLDANHAKAVAQASLSALKQLIISDKKLPGKKNLYIRLGCRGDWPNIKPPGWDPETSAPESPLS